MAKAAHALSAPQQGCNPITPTLETAALHNEWSAALFVWATLLPGSRKEPKVCRQLLELRGRLDVPTTSIAVDVAQVPPHRSE